MKKIFFLIVGGIFLILPILTAAQEKPLVALAGLRIVGSGYGLNGTELQAFNQQSGTTLALVVLTPGTKQIVEVDDSKCTLDTFTDNRGNNLLDAVHWGAFPKVSKDSRYALIEVNSKNRPDRDASRVIAKGTIRLRAATSAATEKIKNLALKVGTQVTIRQSVIQVMKVQEENKGLKLILQINRKLAEDMKDIRFYTTQAGPLDLWGRGSFTFGNATQLEYNLKIKTIPEVLHLEIDLWQGLEMIDLPFTIDTGIGF